MTITQREIRKLWDRSMLSHGFERVKNSTKSHIISSEFSVIILDLDYAPLIREYSGMCSIYLSHLGDTPLNKSSSNTKKESYNFMYISVSGIVEANTQDAILGVRGEEGLYPKDDFLLMLEQNETYVLPVLKQCLNEKGLLEFYKKYNPESLGLVCKDLWAWADLKIESMA